MGNYAAYDTPARVRFLVGGSLIGGAFLIAISFVAGKVGGLNIPCLAIGIAVIVATLAMIPGLRRRQKM